MNITDNQEKKELVEKLLNDKHIDFKQAILLLSESYNWSYPYTYGGFSTTIGATNKAPSTFTVDSSATATATGYPYNKTLD